jgi:capsular polysaccharide transport system permease protein
MAEAAKKQEAPRSEVSRVVEHPASSEGRAARKATVRPRHRLAQISFLLAVVAPTIAAGGYLYGIAADQYASRTAFSVRSSEGPSTADFLGVLTNVQSSTSADAEILYEFIRSQQMVEIARERLPLDTMFNRPENDVVYRLGEERSIEDVVDYWNRMTDVSFMSGSHLIQFEARAFDPESARAIAALVLEESTRLINELSREARDDSVGVAREVLTAAEDRLRAVRQRVRSFRDVEQAVDPSIQARATLGLVAQLEEQLAQLRVELDSQLELVGERSPRIAVLRQTIRSVERQIEQERSGIGAGAEQGLGAASRTLSDRVGEFEELEVELEFARKAYLSALAAFETAQVDAQRQSRYLAPHVEPTLSEEAQYPQRLLVLFTIFLILTVTWTVLLLIAYNVRDKR